MDATPLSARLSVLTVLAVKRGGKKGGTEACAVTLGWKHGSRMYAKADVMQMLQANRFHMSSHSGVCHLQAAV